VQYVSESLSSPISTWRLCGSWLFLIDHLNVKTLFKQNW
jgi:hypothetical protein